MANFKRGSRNPPREDRTSWYQPPDLRRDDGPGLPATSIAKSKICKVTKGDHTASKIVPVRHLTTLFDEICECGKKLRMLWLCPVCGEKKPREEMVIDWSGLERESCLVCASSRNM